MRNAADVEQLAAAPLFVLRARMLPISRPPSPAAPTIPAGRPAIADVFAATVEATTERYPAVGVCSMPPPLPALLLEMVEYAALKPPPRTATPPP